MAAEINADSPAWGEAPGKLLLLGEHAVVYGAPAIGFPLSRGVKASLAAGRGRVVASLGEGLQEPSRGGAAPDELVHRALGPLAADLDVHLRLDIPPMCGYGSSAAVAVALLRARTAWIGGRRPSKIRLWEEALRVEQAAHATPSGVDPAIVVWDRPLVFERAGSERPRVRKQTFATPVHLIAGWCGEHGGTRATVTGLARLRGRQPKLMSAALAALDESARSGSRALRTGQLAEFGSALDLAHGVLGGLGLVDDAVDRVVRRARTLGALGAKMSGAGGQGGAWLATFATRAKAGKAAHILRAEGHVVFQERLG